MKNKLSYTLGTPLYEKTQGAETNKAIVLTNIILESMLAVFILCFLIGSIIGLPDSIKAPPFVWGTLLLTMLLVIDRALWQNYHLKCKKWVVTDSPSAHSFERTTAFILLAGALIDLTQEGPWEDIVESDIAPTLLYALCTVPILHILGSEWKTLKATHKQNGVEITWVPGTALICLWVISEFVEDWQGLSRNWRRIFIAATVAALVAVIAAIMIVLHIVRRS